MSDKNDDPDARRAQLSTPLPDEPAVPPLLDGYITIEAAIAGLGTTARWLRHREHRYGKIPSIRIQRVRYVRPEDVRAWLDAQRQGETVRRRGRRRHPD